MIPTVNYSDCIVISHGYLSVMYLSLMACRGDVGA